MDAKVGDWVVTPRIGKPVEIQALWLNALRVARRFSDRWEDTLERGIHAFRDRFWNAAAGALYDVVDVDHVPGTVDGSIRPNMLFAVGGLPFSIIDGSRARAIVDAAEAQLWTPLGPRSLSPNDPAYRPVYAGGPLERDGAYHQGTVWPWLASAFVEAWVRVHGGTPEAKREARERFIAPLLRHLDEAGLGHVSEIADGGHPHVPRGCPFQAWSVGELLRLVEVVTAEAAARKPGARRGGARVGVVESLAGASTASDRA
jgi:glycogen debranching enzyme